MRACTTRAVTRRWMLSGPIWLVGLLTASLPESFGRLSLAPAEGGAAPERAGGGRVCTQLRSHECCGIMHSTSRSARRMQQIVRLQSGKASRTLAGSLRVSSPPTRTHPAGFSPGSAVDGAPPTPRGRRHVSRAHTWVVTPARRHVTPSFVPPPAPPPPPPPRWTTAAIGRGLANALAAEEPDARGADTHALPLLRSRSLRAGNSGEKVGRGDQRWAGGWTSRKKYKVPSRMLHEARIKVLRAECTGPSVSPLLSAGAAGTGRSHGIISSRRAPSGRPSRRSCRQRVGGDVGGGRAGASPRPPFRREMQPGGARLPLHHRCGKAGPDGGRRRERGV